MVGGELKYVRWMRTEGDSRLMPALEKKRKSAFTGKMVVQFPAVGASDELFFDAASQRISLQGYEGIADVWKEVEPDHSVSFGRIQGGGHGKTSLLVPELKRYYVAVSEHRDVVEGVQGGKLEEGYLEVYEVQP